MDDDGDIEEHWAPFMGAAPDLPHSGSWDSQGYVAPYVATPKDKVVSLLTLLDITPQDVIYDLGCGDGRVVLEAAKRWAARGVGIDLNESLVARAAAKAQAEGISSVEFRTGDIFDPTLDLSSASVVFLYLLPEGLERVRPILDGLAEKGQLRAVVASTWPLKGSSMHEQRIAELEAYLYRTHSQ
eukprot:GILK01006181.1.p1 GENE.GILK01006181.1~~GILK01006181.1.p1  ORF type:complete len:196 (-),score=19.34 GILK01006181.1:241-795(-)